MSLVENDALFAQMKSLRLIGMHDYLSSMAPAQWQAARALLQQVLSAECAYRKTRALSYRLKMARCPQLKTLDDFDAGSTPVQSELLDYLKTGQFVSLYQNIILMGSSGTGKTHLALALAHQAIQAGKRVKFFRLNQLARELLHFKKLQQEQQFINRLVRFDLLVLDELGYCPVDNEAQAMLFELVVRSYEHSAIVITTHLQFDEWQNIFGSPKATQAVIDRLTHHAHIIETGNISWRFKEAKEKRSNRKLETKAN